MKMWNTYINPLLPMTRWSAQLASVILIGVFILMFMGEGFDLATITPRDRASLFFFPFGFVERTRTTPVRQVASA